MASYSPIQSSFIGGEISPRLWNRFDIEAYPFALSECENMVVLTDGTLTRRPGLRWVHLTKGWPMILVPFVYSEDDRYMLEFGVGYMRVHRNHATVTVSSTNLDPYELVTDIVEDELDTIQYWQSGDVMWLVSGENMIRKLTRLDHNSWTIADADIDDGPFLTQNIDRNVKIAATALVGPVTLTVTTDGPDPDAREIFEDGHVGALWRISHLMPETRVSDTYGSVAVSADGDGSLCPVDAEWEVRVNGWGSTWAAVIEVQISTDGGTTWTPYHIISSNGTTTLIESYVATNNEGQNIRLRTACTEYTSGSIQAVLYVRSHTQNGVVRISAVTNAYAASATVLSELGSTDPTFMWSEGAFSDVQGWPKAIGFNSERLILASTDLHPLTLYGGESGDYESFLAGTDATDAFGFTLSQGQQDPIRWILSPSARQFIIGTGTGLIELNPLYEGGFTPTNPPAQGRRLSLGTSPRMPSMTDDSILLVGGEKDKYIHAYEVAYSNERGGLIARDMTQLASHILLPNCTHVAFQREEYPILWCRRSDGILAAATYVFGGQAWHRHRHGDDWEIVYCAVLFNELWAVVKHESDAEATPQYRYPTLQDLTAAEIPAVPADPTMTAAVTEVANAGQLQAMNGANRYYLSADIDLTGVVWTPITNFSGVLDGRGFTISNLSINSPASDYRAFFGSIANGAEIYDVTFADCTVTGRDYVAIVVAKTAAASASFKFKDITIQGCTVTGASCVSPLLAIASDMAGGSIFDCAVNDCTINAEDDSGGIAGYLTRRFSAAVALNVVRCTVTGGALNLTYAPTMAGGCFGYIDAGTSGTEMTIHTCTSSMPVNASITTAAGDAEGLGGFAGYLSGWGQLNLTCVNCASTGAVTISSAVGNPGYIGHDGGFVGFHGGGVNYINCYTTGALTIDASTGSNLELIGGFSGKWDVVYGEEVLHCWSTTDVTITTLATTFWYAIGGFIGGFLTSGGATEGGTISRSWSTGNVTISFDGSPSTTWDGGLGAFIGIVSCVTGVGTANPGSSIENCYAWGSVTISGTGGHPETTSVGGFIGSQFDDADSDDTIAVTNCYCAQTNTAEGSSLTGQVPTRDQAGGFIGGHVTRAAAFTTTAAFYDTETSGQSTDTLAVGHATLWMQTKANYVAAGWDFDTIWYGLDNIAAPGDSYGIEYLTPFAIEEEIQDQLYLDASESWDGGDPVAVTDITANVITLDEWPEDSNGDALANGHQVILRATGTDADDVVCTVANADSTALTLTLKDEANTVDVAITGTLTGAGTLAWVENTLSGLDHLAGLEVTVLADGVPQTCDVSDAGVITLDGFYNTIHAGLNYTSHIKSLPQEILTRGGITVGKAKQFLGWRLSVYRSYGGRYGLVSTAMGDIPRPRQAGDTGTNPVLITDSIPLERKGGAEKKDLTYRIEQDQPWPMTIRGIVPEYDV